MLERYTSMGLRSGENEMDAGASAHHERMKLEGVEDAAAALARAVETERAARELRDRAVRAAVKAGVPPSRVAEAAGIQPVASRI